MKRFWRFLLGILVVLVLVVVVVPLVIPIPEIQGQEPQELADEDSLFMDVPFAGTDDISTHYKISGEGDLTFVLVHGFTFNLYTWEDAMPFFNERGRVIRYDQMGTGLTERPSEWTGQNPYSSDGRTTHLLNFLDALELDNVILVGHSAGGVLITQAALQQPERVQGLILVDPALYRGGSPAIATALINTPQGQRMARLIVRQLVEGNLFAGTGFYDQDAYYDETEAYYKITTQVENWDYGLVQLFSAPTVDYAYTERFPELEIPVLLVQGREDSIVALADVEQAAAAFPNAELAVLDQCGHFPHDECTEAFTDAVGTWLDSALE